MDNTGKKIQDKSVELVTEFMVDKFTFGEAMASLSMAMITIAQTTGVDRQTFVNNMGNDWDKIIKSKKTH
jgi:hypothetical protein